MTPGQRLTEWLDIRGSELRVVALAFLGAFFTLSFGVLSGAMRSAFFLGYFDSSALPYVLFGSVALGLPAVGLFSRQMTKRSPHIVMRSVIVLASAGLLALYGMVMAPTPVLEDRPAAVGFYLWTVVATLLLTSGFWIVASELFAVREAKRLFGLISAGGALGTFATGLSTSLLLTAMRPVHTVPLLVAILCCVLVVFELLPRSRLHPIDTSQAELRERTVAGLRRIARSRHLRLVAALVLLTAASSYVVDWQLQDAVQKWAQAGVDAVRLPPPEAQMEVNRRIGIFMGAFRGWTGGLAFAIQVLLAARILAGAGVAWSLAVLPLALVLGSTGLLVVPGLVMATLVRGADNTLGKSLYRTVIELLWVPIPSAARRRAKAFIDSIVDNAGDGLGAIMVLLWVTLGHLPSRYLSLFVISMCLLTVYLARAMGAQYFATLRSRLEESGGPDGMIDVSGLDRGDRLGATLTRLDITRVLATTGIHFDTGPVAEVREGREPEDAERPPPTRSEMLHTSDPALLREALGDESDWTPDDLPALTRLLARDAFMGDAAKALAAVGTDAVPYLASVLQDESADFVLRRRIPRVLARIDSPEADQALVEGLGASRFEIRYRVGLALRRRRKLDMAEARSDWREAVWETVRAETSRERPVWELARLLDPAADDDFVEERVGLRGELSLEHTFRLLSLVLEAPTVRAAYHGILLNDPEVKSFAQEYLEQVLPPDVRERLWPFIGDLSASAARRAMRELDDVVADLLKTGATLFGTPESREALQRYLRGDTPSEGSEEGPD